METLKLKSENLCLNYIETGNGRVLHFAHANGFPPGTYAPLFQNLENNFRILAMNFCCQSNCFTDCEHQKPLFSKWTQLAEELISFLDAMKVTDIIGVGHSLGGVATAIASSRRPDLFNRLILLDPVFLEPRIVNFIRIANLLGQKQKFPLAVRARKRRNGWESREEAYEFFKDKPLFSGWRDESLRAYVENGLSEFSGGVRLSCSPEVEARVFETYPTNIWKVIKNISVPCTVARGVDSDVNTDASWSNLEKIRPDIERVEFRGLGHLFPMQDVEKTARLILDATSVS